MSNPTFTFSHQTFGTNSGVPIMSNYSNYSPTNPNTIVSNTYMTPSFGLMDEGFNIQVFNNADQLKENLLPLDNLNHPINNNIEENTMLYAHAPINNEAHSTYQVSEIGNEIINQFEQGDFINAINPLQRENNHNQEQLVSTEYDPTILRPGYNNLEQIFPYYDQNNYIPQSTENSNDNYMNTSINNELAGELPFDEPMLYSNRDINILYTMAFQNMESVQSLTANISEKQKYQEEMNNFFRNALKEQKEFNEKLTIMITEQKEANAKLTNMQKETNEKLTNMQKETNEKLTNMQKETNEKLTEMLQKIGNRLEIQENWSKEAHEWFKKNK